MYLQAKTQADIGSIMPADVMLDNNIPITTKGNNSVKCKVITIRCDDDIALSDSIPIDGIELKGTSTMREVLTFQDDGYPSFSDDNNLDIDNLNGIPFSFHVKVEKGSEDFIFKKWRFLKMKVDALHSLVNVK